MESTEDPDPKDTLVLLVVPDDQALLESLVEVPLELEVNLVDVE